ncbi:hypothetical protein [Kitasatospora sp. NPDC057198]|uniref:hypothetical protein n=1 Tax=Kitasatospora sp. NPDC057198 TaxID=3346046 RepID=UPI0036270583
MERVRELALRQAAGWLTAAELPMAAAELLAAGVGGASPALCDLAGRSGREPEPELLEVLRQAMDELGVEQPESAQAERWAVRELAVRLHVGDADPAGTAALWWRWGNSAEGGAEQGFLEVLRRACCGDCLAGRAREEAESYRRWEEELRAAAAELAGGSAGRRG